MKFFLSTPISAFEASDAYIEYRQQILKFISVLRERNIVYSEIEQICELNYYDKPSDALSKDLNIIDESEMFVIHHPFRMQTSTLIELGYAVALNKKIIIIGKKKDLPYLALGLPEKMNNALIIDTSSLSVQTAEEILQKLQDYESPNEI